MTGTNGIVTLQVVQTAQGGQDHLTVTAGSVCLLVDDTLYTGDTLFARSCGRTDLPGGDSQVILTSLRRLHDLEGDYTVCPGHSGSTTLSLEREYNPFMKQARAL